MDRPRQHPRWADARWLLLISGVFSLSVGLSNTFVNIYLWKVDRTYTSIGWYNLTMYIFMPAAYVLSAWIANRRHAVFTFRIGILLHAAFYLLALLGGTSIAGQPVLLGGIMGAAEGFYWYSFSFLSLRGTKSENRDRYYGLNGTIVAVANMIAPALSGFLIAQEDKFGPFNGYHVMFAISLGLFLLATVGTIKVHAERIHGELTPMKGLRLARQRPWRHLLIGCYAYGLREGVFLFLIGLLMFISTGSEVRLGEFFFMQNLLSSVAFYLAGKRLTPRNRLTVLGVGALAMAGAALLFLAHIDTTLMILYGALVALALPIFIVPLQTLVSDAISTIDPSGHQHDELIISREIAQNAGRVTGLVVFLGLTSWSSNVRVVANLSVLLGFVQVLSWFVIRRGYLSRRGTIGPTGGGRNTVDSVGESNGRGGASKSGGAIG